MVTELAAAVIMLAFIYSMSTSTNIWFHIGAIRIQRDRNSKP